MGYVSIPHYILQTVNLKNRIRSFFIAFHCRVLFHITISKYLRFPKVHMNKLLTRFVGSINR